MSAFPQQPTSSVEMFLPIDLWLFYAVSLLGTPVGLPGPLSVLVSSLPSLAYFVCVTVLSQIFPGFNLPTLLLNFSSFFIVQELFSYSPSFPFIDYHILFLQRKSSLWFL